MSQACGGPTSLIQLGDFQASRFCVGHNPLCGNSHRSAELNAEMAEYFTADNVLKLYRRAEELGVPLDRVGPDEAARIDPALPAQLAALGGPEAAVERRKLPGGTARDAVTAQIAAARALFAA